MLVYEQLHPFIADIIPFDFLAGSVVLFGEINKNINGNGKT